MLRLQPPGACHIEEDASAHDRRHRLDAVDANPRRCLDVRVDVHSPVQCQVLCLVRQGVDVGARVLRHDDDA